MAGQEAYTDAGVTLAVNGQTVRQWSDISGNANNLTQSTSSSRPTLVTNQINGQPVLNFDGTSDYLDGSLDGTITLSSLFVVGNFSVADQGNFDYMINIGTTYTDAISISRSSGEAYYSYTEGALRFGPSLNNSYKLFHQAFTASSPFHFLRINGTSQTVNAHNAQISVGSNIRVGAMLSTAGNQLEGNIAEIIFFNTILNTTQRILVENYLDAKYALGQSSDKFAYQATHPGEVAGIGQESASDNHTDAQGSSIVRINGATDLEDGEYLLWGHDNAGTGNNGTEIPAEYVATGGLRLDQEWRFDLSGGDGSVGTVDITFDMTGINFGTNSAGYQILTDADGNFSNANVNSSITPSVNGSLITFNDVTLSGDGFFTIGNSNEAEECFSIFSDDWQGAGWICSITPDSTVNALISDATTITITTGTDESVNDLTIEGTSGALVLESNSTLVIKGDFTVGNSASVTIGTGATLIFRGANGAQTFTNNSGSAITMYDLTINNASGVTLTGGSFELRNGLTLTNGNMTNSGTFTFLSDATSTAHVNAVPNGSLLTGTYNVQRFVGARDAWFNDIASSGVNTTIADLDGEIFISNIPGGADGVALDQNGQPFTSMWFWDETADVYEAAGSVADAFEVGRGYETWLADDINSWNAQAWELSGTIDMSPVSLTINSAGSRLNLLGNPYPAFLDFNSIATAAAGGIDNDEYWYYDANSASYVSVSGGGSIIPPGQGFWLITSGMTELNIDPTTDILSDENTSTFFKNINQREELKVHLRNENNTRFGSAVYLRKDATAFVGKDDRDIHPLRLADPRSCHMVIENGADQSMVNYVPTHESVLEIPLHIESGLPGDYSINVEGIQAFNEYQCINLVNETTGEQTSLDEKSGYKFRITEDLNPVNLKLVLSKDDYEYCESPASANNYSRQNLEISAQGKVIFVDFYLDRGANAQIEIYNVLGERVYQSSETAGYTRKTIDLGTAETGVYFVNVSINGTLTTDKIILK